MARDKKEYTTFECVLEDMNELYERKNNDYCGNPLNPYENFEFIEHADITAEDGLLTRMSDKFMRVLNLWHREDEAHVTESIDDTLMDLANYAVILLAYRRDKAEASK